MLAWIVSLALAGLLVAGAEGKDQGANETSLEVSKTTAASDSLPKALDSWDVSGGGWMISSNASKRSANTIRRRPAREAEVGQVEDTGIPPQAKTATPAKTLAIQGIGQGNEVPFEIAENSVKEPNPISPGTPSTAPILLAENRGDDGKTKTLDEAKDSNEAKDTKGEAEKASPEVLGLKSPENSETAPNKDGAGSIKTGEVSTGQVTAEAVAVPVSKDEPKEAAEAVVMKKSESTAVKPSSNPPLQVAGKGEVLRVPAKAVAADEVEVKAKPTASTVTGESAPPSFVDLPAKGEEVTMKQGESAAIEPDSNLAVPSTGQGESANAEIKSVAKEQAVKEVVVGSAAEATVETPEKEGDEKADPVVTKPQAAESDADSALMSDANEADKSGGGHSSQQREAATGASGEKNGKKESKMEKAVENAAAVGVVGAVAEMDADTLEPSGWENGYYPTQEDRIYRGDLDYPRSLGGITPQGPDNRSLNSDGLFPYDDPDVVDRPDYDSLFVPANRVLGFFAPREAFVVEGERMEGWSFSTDASLPLLTRSFDPDRAHFKAGPLYMDLLYVGVGTIWSDYRGDQTFQDGYEPGWIPYIEFAPRVLLKITDQFYLSAAAQLVYLPMENRIGFDFGYGGSPLLYTRLNYQNHWKGWDFILYDEINVNTQGILSNFSDEAFQQAGRYSFGINENRRPNDPFDTEDLYLTNAVGAGASTAFLQEDWRLWLNAEHRDFWRSFDFDNHGVSDMLSARVGYNGTDIPFAPYVEYSTYSFDHFDSIYNTVYVGARGRLTENITAEGRVGYLWTYDREPDTESPLWELGLTHRINKDTSHSLWGGETWESDDLTNETALARYIRYSIAHRVTRRLSASAYAQWSKEEDLVAGTPVTDRENYAGMLNYQAGEYTSFNAGVYYEREKPETEPSITDVNWIYRAGVIQQIYSRYTLNFYYQYEDQTGSSNFDEDMFQISLRRYF